MNAKTSDLMWALDVVNRYAPAPLTFEGQPLVNVGGVVLATQETANELRHYTGDPAVDSFKRLCDRDAAERERMERDDRIEAERYETDTDYLDYVLAQSGARRW